MYLVCLVYLQQLSRGSGIRNASTHIGLLLYPTARNQDKVFFRFSVHGRALVIVFFGAFVLLNIAPEALLMFGVVDLLAAIWTALALRSESEPLAQL